VEVSFDIDANGILNVSAKDMATSKKQHITITASSGLSKEEIEKLVKDAQAHEGEDKKRPRRGRNAQSGRRLVFSTEKVIAENREKLPVKIVNEIEEAIEAREEGAEGQRQRRYQEDLRKLAKTAQKVGEEMYKTAQKDAKGDGADKEAGSEKKKEEDVVDAEFEEAKE
jgi:molecular chaperone DnaK